MKKCPYCKTLTNDDVNVCPNCMHDISEVSPMPEATPKRFRTEFYFFFLGLIIGIGGLFAGLSQQTNMNNYYDLYKAASDAENQKKFFELFKRAEFEMWAMWVIGIIGGALVIASIVLFIIHLTKKTKREIK